MMSDILFERGRLCGSIFAIDDEDANYQKLMKQVKCTLSYNIPKFNFKVFELYSHTNAVFPETFPSIRKMEVFMPLLQYKIIFACYRLNVFEFFVAFIMD
jgi:hypothetical protein